MKAPLSAARARRTPGTFERQKYSGHRRELHHRSAICSCRFCAISPRRAELPLSAMPNAGFPKRVGDRIVYPRSSPEYFALFAQEAAELGARILGGCCGTTPEHIRAMAEAVKKLRPATRRAEPRQRCPRSRRSLRARRALPPHRAREPESKLWRKIQAGKFVTSVEIDPPKGVSIERILDQVGRVMASGSRRLDRHQ